MHLGLIGAGRIGLPMAARLGAAGHHVSALARRPSVAAQLRGAGVNPVAAVAATAADTDAVLVCVHSDSQVRQVCLDDGLLAAMRPGTVLVIHTTGTPGTLETLARLGAERSIGVIDAPVSGGPADVAAGAITLFVGGSDGDVTRVRPALASYGDPILHVGGLGSGQRVKLVNNALFAGTIALAADAVRLGRELGIAEDALLAALPHGSSASRAVGMAAAAGSMSTLIGAVGEFLGKDVEAVRSTAHELGGELGLLGSVLDAPEAGALLGRQQARGPA